MVWRRRVMRTRSSRAASLAAEGSAQLLHGAPAPAPGHVPAAQARPAWARGAGASARARAPSAAAAGDILLQDLAAPAGAGDVGGDRGPLRPASCARRGGRHRRRWRQRARPRRARVFAAALAAPACGLVGGAAGAAARAGAFADGAEQRADGDRLPLRDLDLAQHARRRRRHLDRHLVGLELDQRLVGLDRVARLLEPLADGRLGHALAQRRHVDLDRHRSHRHFSATVVASRHLPAPQPLLVPAASAPARPAPSAPGCAC